MDFREMTVNVLSGLESLTRVSVVDFTEGDVTFQTY